MRARVLLALVAVAALVQAPPISAQGPSNWGVTINQTNVTLTTTAETIVVTSDPVTFSRPNSTVCVWAWAQLTTGTDTASVTPRIRRGTSTSGTLINEANAITIGAAVGSTEQFVAMGCEDRSGVEAVRYVFTLSQASASADGTGLQAGILILIR
jgi:hypothetical protein